MVQLFRALRFLPVFLLIVSLHLRAQDMPVRVEAIRLLERANAVSHSARILPNYRQDATFRAYRLDGTTQDGTYSGIYSGDIERYEIVFGNYHAISIHYPDKIV